MQAQVWSVAGAAAGEGGVSNCSAGNLVHHALCTWHLHLIHQMHLLQLMHLMHLMQNWKTKGCKSSQEKVLGRGCSDKGGPGQLLEGECEAFQSGERTEKYRNWKCSYQKYWNWKVLKFSPAIFNIFAIIVAPFQQDILVILVTRNFSQILLLLLLFVQQTWNRSC